MLGIAEVTLILAGKGGIVKQPAGGGAENLCIAGPTVALPRGAVRGQIRVVVFGTPHGVVKEFVQQLIGGGKPPRALHVCVHRNGREIGGIYGKFTLDQHILKAENRKGSLIVVAPLAADIVHLLQRGQRAILAKLDIFLGKLAVFVQHLAKAQADALPGLGLHCKLQNARYVLPEIQNRPSARCVQNLGGKTLMLFQRLIVGGCGLYRVCGTFGVSAVGGDQTCVHTLPVLVVGKTDRAVIRPLPAAVCADRLHGAVRQGQFQLSQQLCFGAVLIAQTIRTDTAAVPAISQLKGQRVVALPQQICDVIGLVLYALAVVGNAGGQHKAVHGLPIDCRLIDTASSGIQACFFHLPGRKMLLKAVRRVTPFGVRGIVAGNPLCLPVGGGQQADFKNGALRPVPRRAVFIPELHLPHNVGAACQRHTRIDRLHGGAFHPAGIPQHVFVLVPTDNSVRGLPHPLCTVPEQLRLYNIQTDGMFQIFSFQANCVHGVPRFRYASARNPRPYPASPHRQDPCPILHRGLRPGRG